VSAYVGSSKNLKDLKEVGLFCGSFLRKGEVFAYVGFFQNRKDLKGGTQRRKEHVMIMCRTIMCRTNGEIVKAVPLNPPISMARTFKKLKLLLQCSEFGVPASRKTSLRVEGFAVRIETSGLRV